MCMTDPVADMLVRIRNAQAVSKLKVDMPASKMKLAIAKILEEEGYIDSFQVICQPSKKNKSANKSTLAINLKYYADRPVIDMLKRVSRPGLRVYKKCDEIPSVMSGLGVTIISTSKGLMADKSARALGIGGEIVLYVA